MKAVNLQQILSRTTITHEADTFTGQIVVVIWMDNGKIEEATLHRRPVHKIGSDSIKAQFNRMNDKINAKEIENPETEEDINWNETNLPCCGKHQNNNISPHLR